MTQIKSEIQTYTPIRGMIICENESGDYILKTDADERHAKELQGLKDKAVALARITQGAMILDGYELEDSCVKSMNELIDELQKLNEQ